MTSLPTSLKQFLLKEPSAESLTGFGPIRSASITRAAPYMKRPIAAALERKELPLPLQNPLFQYPPLDITGTLNPAQIIASLIQTNAENLGSPNSAVYSDLSEPYLDPPAAIQGYFIPIPADVRTTVDEQGHIIAYRDPLSKFHQPANLVNSAKEPRASTQSKTRGNKKTQSSQNRAHQPYFPDAPSDIGTKSHKAKSAKTSTKGTTAAAKLPRSSRPAARERVI